MQGMYCTGSEEAQDLQSVYVSVGYGTEQKVVTGIIRTKYLEGMIALQTNSFAAGSGKREGSLRIVCKLPSRLFCISCIRTITTRLKNKEIASC